MSEKDKVHPYRGLKRRLERKKKHMDRADFERMMFELKQSKKIVVWVRPDQIKNDWTPTDYFVVEFNLKDPMTIADFEEMVLMEMGMLL